MPAPINLNLLSGKASEIRQERVVKSKVQFAAAFVLVSFLGFVVLLAGISTFMKRNLTKLQTQAETETQKIQQLAYVEDTYLVLQNKVKLLEDYFGLNQDVINAVEDLKTTLPPNVTLSDLTLDNEQMLLTLSLSAKSYTDINEFINLAIDKVDKNIFSKIDFQGITRDPEGTYSTSLLLVYTPGS